MKYFCSAIWNPNSTPVLFGIFSKFIARFSRAIWDEELYNISNTTRGAKIILLKYFLSDILFHEKINNTPENN